MPHPNLLLLHGSASSSAQWRSLAGVLAGRFRVHAPDLGGYGDVPVPSARPFTLAVEAAPIAQWLQERGEPVHVVAHSYGAAVALHLALAMPGRIASLLVYEPAAFHLLSGGTAEDQLGWVEISSVAAAVADAAARGSLDAGAARFVDYWNGVGAWALLPPAARALVLQAVPKVAIEFHAALNEPTRVGDLAGLHMPRTIVHGDRTPLAARRVVERLAAAWPDARLAVLAAAGHMGPVTHRDAFRALVEEHLARVGAMQGAST